MSGNGVLFGMLAYVLVQFAIGIIVSRRMASDSDYILAGRSLGTFLVSFSVFASFFGAEAIVASAGAVYSRGLAGAVVDPFGYALALLIVGAFLAAPLWSRGLTTFADLFRARYSPGVEKLVVVMLLPGSLFWAAAQIRAFGQVLSANSSLDLETAILIAAALVGAYSVVGGLMADSVTDVIQGLAVIAGLVMLTALISVAAHQTPLAAPVTAAAAEPHGLLLTLEELAIAICGTVVSVELISRFLGARSVAVASNGTRIGAVLYLVVGFMPVYLGLAGAQLIPGLEQPEQIIPKLAESFMPGVMRIAFIGAIVSAILSTVHSALHGPASQIAHNIVLRVYPDISARTKLWVVRSSVMVLSVVAYGLARGADGLHELVETASSFGSAGVFVVAVFALFTRIGGTASAYGALIGGMGVWLAARFAAHAQTPYLIALGAACLAYIALATLPAPSKHGV